jgi:hypothetical protein
MIMKNYFTALGVVIAERDLAPRVAWKTRQNMGRSVLRPYA